MNHKGFTLLESLIALAILGIVLAGLLPSFVAFMDSNSVSEERSDAVAAAQAVMERLRREDPASWPKKGSSSPQVVAVGGREYEVVTRYCLIADYCGADSRHVFVEVNYGGESVYSVESVYTRLQ